MNKIAVKVVPTTNASIVKFEANIFLTNHKNYEFKNIDEAKLSPLAQQLFYLPFTKTVYISGNFVAIEKYNIVQWPEVQAEVAEQIEEYLNSGQAVVIDEESSKRLPISVYAETTPNPKVMKFVANKKLVLAPFEFKNIDEAKLSALATSLFHFPFVKEVFLDENYVSVTKYDVAEWEDVTQELREFIRLHLQQGNGVIAANVVQEKKASVTNVPVAEQEDLDETSKQIIDILEEYVKPAVASDGGNILFKSYDEGSKTVNVILQGACSGCPSSTFTLKNGIENMLRSMLNDKVQSVNAVNG